MLLVETRRLPHHETADRGGGGGGGASKTAVTERKVGGDARGGKGARECRGASNQLSKWPSGEGAFGALTLSAVDNRTVVAAPSQVAAGRADDTIPEVPASACHHAAAVVGLPSAKGTRTRVVVS